MPRGKTRRNWSFAYFAKDFVDVSINEMPGSMGKLKSIKVLMTMVL